MRTPATIAIALVAGVAITLVVATVRSGDARRDAILSGIAGSDPALRIAAWDLIPRGYGKTNRERPSTSPGESVGRGEILTHLRDAGDAVDPPARAEAARQFVERGWLPDPYLIEAAAALGDSGPLEAWLDDSWSADPGSLEPVRDALDAAFETADDDRASAWTERLFGPSTPEHRDAVHAWLADRKDEPPAIEAAQPLGRAVLALALHGRLTEVAEPSRLAAAAAILTLPEGHPSTDVGPVPAWMLAASGTATHLDRLRERAEAEDADAIRTQAMLDVDRVVRAERRVLSNRSRSFDRRLLAASRLIERDATPGDAALLGLLAAGPTDSDGTVHGAAVVAWTGLSPTARRRLERRWLDSEDPRDVRAGILLGTLRRVLSPGTTNPDVVETIQSRVHELARSGEAPPSLRRTARLA
ncbi:MAG: hypothetical protein VX672_00285, partial [Planctomycetota bacterium]|nr:hypothetical protein [Planctomycetota bacterium]